MESTTPTFIISYTTVATSNIISTSESTVSINVTHATTTSTSMPVSNVTTGSTTTTTASMLTATSTRVTTTPTGGVTNSLFTITTSDIMTTSPSTDDTDSDSMATTAPSTSSSGVIIAVVVVVVVLLLIAIVVTIFIILYLRIRNSKCHNSCDKNSEKPPLSVTGLAISESDYTKPLADNDDQRLSKNNLELQNRSPDCQEKQPAEILTQLQEKTLSVINPDYERAKKTDCSSITESTIANQRLSFENSGNSTFTESITPAAIMSDKVCDSKDDDGLAPCTSIYADPVPFVKSKGPPVVTMDNIKQIHELGTGLFGQLIQ